MIDQIGVLWKCIAESFGQVEGSSPEKLVSKTYPDRKKRRIKGEEVGKEAEELHAETI